MGEKDKHGIVPPYPNRGVQNTEQERLIASVDWLSLTFKVTEDVSEVIRIIGLNPSDFRTMTKGTSGYKKALFFNQIKVMYDGSEDMGIHVEMSGQGCRTFEQYSNLTWRDLFIRLNIHYAAMANITRLDVAVDDFTGYFKIPYLILQVKKGNVVSKFKMAKQISNFIIKTGEEIGHTLYFGRPTSDIQIRFYEKNIEQSMKGNIVPSSAQIWNRTEIQARDDRATMIAHHIAEGKKTLGDIVCGTLKNYITFKRAFYKNGKKTTDTNKSRWDVAIFWKSFLGNVEELKLTQKVSEVTIEKKYAWIDYSVKKTIAMLTLAFPNDYKELIEHFLITGMEKMEDEDWDIVNQFKEKKITLEEYLDTIKKAYPSQENRDK